MSNAALASRLSLLALACALAACTWVPLSDAGQGVRVAKASDTSACEKVGVTNAKTADRVLLFARNERKIHEELQALARNEAADMGGNAVVPIGDPVEGRQSFDVYRCSAP